MVLARSMSGTIGGHAPIISIHDLSVPMHMVAAILIGGGSIALSIKPTGFVTDETHTHNLRIMELVLYLLIPSYQQTLC